MRTADIYTVKLVASKTRVAPLDVPRLELFSTPMLAHNLLTITKALLPEHSLDKPLCSRLAL